MDTKDVPRRTFVLAGAGLAAGISEQQILQDCPELEQDDFRAVCEYAARVGRRSVLANTA